MKREANSKTSKSGLPPGYLSFTGEQKVDESIIHKLSYSVDELKTQVMNVYDESLFVNILNNVNWFDLRGIHDINLIKQVGEQFDIHPLVLERIVDPYQRSKFEEFNSGLFFLFKSISFNREAVEIHLEQVSMYFTDEYLLSFQEEETDLFVNIRNRITKSYGKIRSRKADYLAFAILDVIVDSHFLVLEEINLEIELLEEELLDDVFVNVKERAHNLHRVIQLIRKQIISMREGVTMFSKSEDEFISDDTKLFIRDIGGQMTHQVDMIDNQRELISSIKELYNSEINYKMNQIMKLLTIITTIFVPLSFLAGIYGMNFKHIPELEYQNGYFLLIGLMISIAIGLIVWFKSLKWF